MDRLTPKRGLVWIDGERRALILRLRRDAPEAGEPKNAGRFETINDDGEESSMQSRNYMLSAALALTATFVFATEAPAQAKEGTVSFTFAGFGTAKAIQIGKDRFLLVIDENGLDEGSSDSMFDHTSFHCAGLGDFTKGVGQVHLYCVRTDPAGDQFVLDLDTGTMSLGQGFKGSETLTGGTGKFSGITGSGTFVFDGNTFKPAEQGTYISHGTHNLSYKLP
jgi:hypothetical protein